MTSRRLAAALALSMACACATVGGAVQGAPAPALRVTLLDGSAFELAGQRGQVVLVSFWATWCPPCREEMPLLDAFYLAHRAQGLVLVGISEDRRRDRGEVERVGQTIHYPLAMHGDAAQNGFGDPAVLPMLYAIDRAGRLWATLAPGDAPLDQAALEATLLPLLEREAAKR